MPIIAAVDQSERAETVIKQAKELAEVYDAELHIVHVGDFKIDLVRTEEGSPTIDTTRHREAAEEIAAEVAERVTGIGDFTPVGLIGDPAEQLIKYSRENDAECIVVSGRKRSPLGQALFGSVTQALLLNSNLPIVAITHNET